MKLSLGFSPCPNDCFILYALAHGKVHPEFDWDIYMEDVETLNVMARRGRLDVTKISYHGYGQVMDEYVMLRSGGALGQGVGPLIVSKEKLASLSGRRIAIPGGLTTANLLLRLSQPFELDTIELRYDKIMPAVARGEVDAGLIIHESRFTYPEHGLRSFQDLGAWWQGETGLPLPLGGIMAKRSLGEDLLAALEAALKDSLRYAYAHPAEAQPFIAAHAQEMSPTVRQKHIDLYVNRYSFEVGEDGEQAVNELLRRGQARGFLPEPAGSVLFERASQADAPA
jgi:1,4-dihydroxy-6-naphthoate synthase